MAIRDLLWICPLCGREGGLQKGKGGEVCEGCGTRYRRASGSSIVAMPREGSALVRSVAEWLELLDGRTGGRADGQSAVFEGRVQVRFAAGERAIRSGGRLLNYIEQFGDPVDGELLLEADRIVLTTGSGREEWLLDEITAVQPASSTIQLKLRGRPVLSLSFPGGSPRVWEERITGALRRHYRQAGRGEILEFMPRIVSAA